MVKEKVVLYLCGGSMMGVFGVGDIIRNTLEGIVASWMYPHKCIISRFANKIKTFQEDVNKIKNDSNSLLIHSPIDSPTTQRTTDREKLLVTYQMGQEAAERILGWIT